MTIARTCVSAILKAAIPLLFAIAPALANADTLADVAGRYRIDASSRIGFVVEQIGGGGISGDFKKFSGVFALNNGDISRSSIEFTLFPESVNTGQSRIENFLRSDAVFDAQNFPTVTFKSTHITQTSANTATIDGILTARGKSSPASFQASLATHDRNAIVFHVEGKVMRSRYGMDVGTPIYSNVVQFNMTIHGQRG
ncbi:YceI family protein [Phyllobacterium sp. 22229]|uniref:Polyisoprenoid-binding protein n=1 Tax=Phyllobacterium myrsinacearum TaxID=28101 RepID=A0A2S9JYL6_9HYPH|nr:YceI family protein [Phyllobacterium myrsinacearum]PRD58426.1 polyisoprenoid-binding protein [Phyllobacterium myrsinacearum]PWV96663.1 polyisoprenoid-binding protein YceI [Phyllobacterium myrsinacearum]RZV09345.1 polyisoprenoid-binding protein YceI [Phyllobacterium myrsinacearum]